MKAHQEAIRSGASVSQTDVGTAAPGCPAEQSSGQILLRYLFRLRPQPRPHLHSMCTEKEFFSIARFRAIGHPSKRTLKSWLLYP
jgi:hypothetical protein